MTHVPRPRFQALPSELQHTLLDSAFEEFSGRGYANSSLNRILRTAGVSKGSFYYYFDDKRDLYREVVRVGLRRLLVGQSPPAPGSLTSDDFWPVLETQAVELSLRLQNDPPLLAVLHDALRTPSGTSAVSDETEEAITPWVGSMVRTGQDLGTVRSDLPADLLVAVALNLGRTVDEWLLRQPAGERGTADEVRKVVGIMRNALSP